MSRVGAEGAPQGLVLFLVGAEMLVRPGGWFHEELPPAWVPVQAVAPGDSQVEAACLWIAARESA